MQDEKPDNDKPTSPPSFSVERVGSPINPGGRPSILLPLVLFSLLLIVAIFYLPEWLPKANNTALPAPEPVTSKLEDSPFQDAQLAKARREAQDVLQQLLTVQQELENIAVQRWAEESFQQALQFAADGDSYYQQRQFTQALAQYQTSLEALQSLQSQGQQVLEAALNDGQAALANDDVDAAIHAFELAYAMAPEQEAAVSGLQRAQNLPALLKLLTASQYAEEDGKLDDAIEFANQAHGLNSMHLGASQTLARLQQNKLDRLHRRYMSSGLSALANNDTQQAIDAFTQALHLKPKDQDSLDAMRQAKSKQLAQRIAQLMQDGQTLEASEQWPEAIERYKQADALQSGLVQVRVALLRAQARAELDELLSARLAAPLALRDERHYANAAELLDQASRIKQPGPRLSDQIDDLQHLLIQARQSVTVQLLSDKQTQVQLFKVGGLGVFDSKQIQLYPGKYILQGTRAGYRDVMHEFVLQAGEAATTISIRCTEKIGSI
ncbi:hypothetical protein [Bowmanella yangjiangensis]|uniref:Tetratricopeptide repeat protein n=1 Tax=Bowmanella yangjiangensis TaxID=2811230 RepID=A0ABS3CPR5_9ALTE|nr:hypothetical protein [Bowmanella yangjiangensis]MBN7819077.1 hypothetical protein [Bowmanella yangjiangensis]